jgi:hypothetical protein
MGNRMSHYSGGGFGQLDHDEGVVEQLDYDGHAPEPYDSSMPRLRGGDASYFTNSRIAADGRSATTEEAGYGRLSPLPNEEGANDDLYGVPAHEFYAARGSRGGPRQASPVAGRHARNGGGNFDFNDVEHHPNPWQGVQPQQRREPEHYRMHSPGVRPQVDVEVGTQAGCCRQCGY